MNLDHLYVLEDLEGRGIGARKHAHDLKLIPSNMHVRWYLAEK